MRARRIALWIGVGLALAAVLELLPRPVPNVFWGVVYNAGHTPLFGVGSIVLLQLSKLILAERLPHYRYHYYVAFVGCGVAGLASELLQFFQVSRDADGWDLLRDMIGASVFLAMAATFDRRARAEIRWAAARPGLVRALAVVAFIASFTEIALVELAYRHRDRSFPTLLTFDTGWERWFYDAHQGATTRRVPTPAEWTGHAGGEVLEVTFGEGYFPRLEITDPVCDWRAYRALVIDIYSPNRQPLEIAIQIRDRFVRDTRAERYERWFPIAPGANRLEVALDEVRTGAPARELDMSTVRSLTLLMREQPAPVRLYFDDLRLE